MALYLMVVMQSSVVIHLKKSMSNSHTNVHMLLCHGIWTSTLFDRKYTIFFGYGQEKKLKNAKCCMFLVFWFSGRHKVPTV
jgi:hypothetical protein